MTTEKQAIERDDIHGQSTYKYVTAENILKQFSIILDEKTLKQQLQSQESFYRTLVALPASHLHAKLQLEQTKYVLQVAQNDFLENFAQLRKRHINNVENENSTLTKNMAKLEKKINTIADKMFKLRKTEETLGNKVKDLSQDAITSWNKLVDETAIQISQAVGSAGLKAGADFTERLKIHLSNMGADVDLNSEAMKTLKITEESSFIIKSIAATLVEVS